MKKCVMIFCLLGVLSIKLFATSYYVSTSGNDSNDGTSASTAWRTLAKACSSVSANQGHIINIGSGTFTEDKMITIPSGVSVIGAGSSKTEIKINYFFDMGFDTNPHVSTFFEKFVIQIDGTDQTIKGFTLDGQNKKNHGGIFARNATNVVFDDLNIHDFKYCGLWTLEVKNVEIKQCYFRNNAYGSKSHGDSGNVQYHNGDGLSFHDNIILEEGPILGDGPYGLKTGRMGGYGMKAQWLTWGGANSTELKNLKIFNNNIAVPQTGAWNNGQAPAIVIEFLALHPNNLEIYNNDFNNCISYPHPSDFIGGRIHHNRFTLGVDRYAYAIEASTNDLEIDHNFFDGGIYPIASFGGDPRNQKIHHNIFVNQWAGREVVMHVSPKNFKFFNNTIIDTKGVSRVLSDWGKEMTLTNPDIRNNIFVSTFGKNRNIFGANVTGGTVSNNAFYNVIEKGTNNVITDPLINYSGDRPSPYFELKQGSPAIDAGVGIPEITIDLIGLPDLGAYEYGKAAWPIGNFYTDSQNPTAPALLTGISKSTYLILNWEASSDDNFVKDYVVYRNGEELIRTTDLTYKVENLTPSTPYIFAVKAIDVVGKISESSNVLSINTTVADTEAPSMPTNLKASAITYKSFLLTWSTSTDNELVAKYEAYKNGVLFASPTDTTLVFAGLESSTVYDITVKSIDITGNVSVASILLQVATLTLPDPYVTAKGESAGTGDVAMNLADGNNNTKWLYNAKTAWIQYAFKELHLWNTYTIVSGNDGPTRDPRSWTLNGSNDGTTWDSLDTKINQKWTARKQSKTFTFKNADSYKFYKLEITANNGGTSLQASEITFSFDSTVGIETSLNSDKILIYPNPSNGLINIELKESKTAEISVYDINGKLVYSKKMTKNTEQIDLTAYSGMFLIKVDSKEFVSTRQVFIK